MMGSYDVIYLHIHTVSSSMSMVRRVAIDEWHIEIHVACQQRMRNAQ